MTSKKSKLTPLQIELGAMVLAIFNLGQDRLMIPLPMNEKEVRLRWTQCLNSHSDADVSIDPERDYWAKQLKKGDAYSIASVKEHLPWLFR